MRTNVSIDQLLEEAQKIGGHSTKNETITAALEEYIRRRKRVIRLFGNIEFDSTYDYKKQRRRKT